MLTRRGFFGGLFAAAAIAATRSFAPALLERKIAPEPITVSAGTWEYHGLRVDDMIDITLWSPLQRQLLGTIEAT